MASTANNEQAEVSCNTTLIDSNSDTIMKMTHGKLDNF